MWPEGFGYCDSLSCSPPQGPPEAPPVGAMYSWLNPPATPPNGRAWLWSRPERADASSSPRIRGALKDEARYASDLVGGIFSDLAQPLAQHGCGLRKDHPEFAQEPADAIDTGGAFLLQALAQAMNAQHALLRDCLGGHKVHMGSGGGLADRSGVVGVVLAVAALQTVRRYELRWNDARIQSHRK